MSYMPPPPLLSSPRASFPRGTEREREKDRELIKGVVLQLSDSESYRIVSWIHSAYFMPEMRALNRLCWFSGSLIKPVMAYKNTIEQYFYTAFLCSCESVRHPGESIERYNHCFILKIHPLLCILRLNSNVLWCSSASPMNNSEKLLSG